MAKKKQLKPLEDPPMAPSSEEEEAEALSGDDEEEEEEEISDDSSSEEKDDDFIPSSKSGKPISLAKPKGDSLASKKRQIDISYSVNAKRAKIAEETKKPWTFQRLWSEEDEVSLLQGMIDFKADTGKSPYEEMDRFYELTSKSISFEASKVQFVDKIRCLKRKYMGKVKQSVESLTKAHDIDCLRLADHIWGSHGMALNSNVKKTEKKVVEEEEEEELAAPESAAKCNGTPKKSKKKKHVSVEGDGDKVEEDRQVLVNGGEDREVLVGGEEREEDREVLANGDKEKEVLINGGGASDWFEDSFLVGSIAGLGVSEQFVKQKWSTVTVEMKKRMEEKWKLLQAKEMELVMHKAGLMREIVSVIAEAT